MSQEIWHDVEDYFQELIVKPRAEFANILKNSREAELPEISITASEGKFLELLVRASKIKRILEVGTLGGFSTAWMAQGLPPDGELITLELEPKHAEVAKRNLAQFEFTQDIDIRVGDARESLKKLVDEGTEPFDLIFLDADKESYSDYLDWSLKLSRPSTLIIADNVVRDGEVINRGSEDAMVQGVRKFNQNISDNPQLSATVLQTVGSKGYDGFCLIQVIS